MHEKLKKLCAIVKENKFYFFAPLVIFLALLIAVSIYIGPGVIVSFIYAGI